MPDNPHRALLFMPGDDRHKIEKGAAMQVDAIIMDLEDGVAVSHKAQARETVRRVLQEADFGQTERLVRINPILDTPELWQEDIRQTITGKPDAYVIPKVETGSQLLRAANTITYFERENGLQEGAIKLMAIVESAMGIVNLDAIAASPTPRLTSLAFGAEDLAGDLGATRTPDGWEVFYARSKLVLHARAHGLQAIDTPFVDLAAEDSMLLTEAEQAHYLGYTGKLAIHPRQVETIQKVFTPSEDAVRRARDLLKAHVEHQAAGEGVFAYEGKMVDMPMVRAAETVLERARAAGIDVDNV